MTEKTSTTTGKKKTVTGACLICWFCAEAECRLGGNVSQGPVNIDECKTRSTHRSLTSFSESEYEESDHAPISGKKPTELIREARKAREAKLGGASV